ncbi:thioredoxin-like fold protein [Artemisia annua]|uniref:Glutaredoxin-dependent peroxiredoxin n=2 Tax=Anthemideae TaxID=102810 RepID=A0A2U1QGU0_ARTAN|nr:thioredoxin-like fold protein [Artemisia annua]
MAPIAVNDVIPDGTLAYFDENDEMKQVSVHSLAAGKKVVIFGVPGAFTPTCSMKHVPGFIEKSEELKAKGVEELLLISVNDPFVMKAWRKSYPETKNVKFLADGSASYTHALGLELDLNEKGLGIRSRRFALLVDNLKVVVANIESGGEFTVSSADEILAAL